MNVNMFFACFSQVMHPNHSLSDHHISITARNDEDRDRAMVFPTWYV
jgi:hypothetical protein